MWLIQNIQAVEFEISVYGSKAKESDGLSTVYQTERVRCVGITYNCIKIEMNKFIAQLISELPGV